MPKKKKPAKKATDKKTSKTAAKQTAQAAKQLQKKIDHFRQAKIFQDRLFIIFLGLSVLVCIAIVCILIAGVRPKDVVVPLQYSTVQGFDELGAWWRLYGYGLFSIAVTLGNTILASILYQKSRIASFFLVIGTLAVNVFELVILLVLISHLNI